ncbi:hypothetical protein PKB_3013 [Pseudomonas knackmussii B13]|uniref:Rieske domain-containing protein n=1 Tax=Pseudomonas knackmussii (strain DSM 6978 / CCUG 54928 / LMG 23759 / B13) TaxID=1301098 RepID=A0A024HH49_PSEKB|nr:Rieske 2Fe-2S domain-containing protein [Pseudomonas knackmussii]CDF84360.1 hypothetical protein PKB_3013 [Pseudomonas knackmussii B13]
MSERFAIAAERLPEPGGRRLFLHGERGLLLFNVAGEFYAIDDGCPHNGASLFSGQLQGRLLQCPAHGLRFDLANGCAAGIKGFGVRRHAIEWDGTTCIVVITDSAPQEISA